MVSEGWLVMNIRTLGRECIDFEPYSTAFCIIAENQPEDLRAAAHLLLEKMIENMFPSNAHVGNLTKGAERSSMTPF